MSNVTENKDLARRFVAGINDRDLDGLARLVAEDVVNHAAIPEAQGVAGLRMIFTKLWAAMPDMRNTIEDIIAEDDRVVLRVTLRGTQTGPLPFARMALPATGKSVTTEQIHVFRVANGKIVEHWAGRDDIGFLRQIGQLPGGGA